MKPKKSVAERYKEQGRVQFACWLDPKVIHQIKAIAGIENKTIPEVITDRFSDVKFEGKGNKVTVKFSRQLEEA